MSCGPRRDFVPRGKEDGDIAGVAATRRGVCRPRADRFTKRIEDPRQGAPLYWLVDADQHQVEVWAPGDVVPRFEGEQFVWHPAGAGRLFNLPLGELFKPI